MAHLGRGRSFSAGAKPELDEGPVEHVPHAARSLRRNDVLARASRRRGRAKPSCRVPASGYKRMTFGTRIAVGALTNMAPLPVERFTASPSETNRRGQ
jgi:hypothetical protein